jgi:hypothetical protein
MDKEKSLVDLKTILDLELIAKKEPEFYDVLNKFIEHLAITYQDKYEAAKEFVNTKNILYDPIKGRYINNYQILRYAQRHLSDGSKFKKGENASDMYKIGHYALFDVVRLNRMENTKNEDIKD